MLRFSHNGKKQQLLNDAHGGGNGTMKDGGYKTLTDAKIDKPHAEAILDVLSSAISRVQGYIEQRIATLGQRIDDRFSAVKDSFAAIKDIVEASGQHQKDSLAAMNQRIDDLQGQLKESLAAMNQRFDDMNKRFGDLQSTMRWAFGLLAFCGTSAILTIIGIILQIYWQVSEMNARMKHADARMEKMDAKIDILLADPQAGTMLDILNTIAGIC